VQAAGARGNGGWRNEHAVTASLEAAAWLGKGIAKAKGDERWQ
jgi:hypothetical protein